jgi:hypothetical protein
VHRIQFENAVRKIGLRENLHSASMLKTAQRSHYCADTTGKRAIKKPAEKCLIIEAIAAIDMRGETGRLIP